MNAMRQAVIMSRVREGARSERQIDAPDGVKVEKGPLSVHWTDVLYLATKGGAEALGLSSGVFAKGNPFDAQLSASRIPAFVKNG